MANFIATQSFTRTGLCETLVSTDTSDYTSNTEGITAAEVVSKKWTFRNSSGTIIRQETTDNTVYTCSCAISLLTLNITVELSLYIYHNGAYGTYTVQNGFLIPCIGV